MSYWSHQDLKQYWENPGDPGNPFAQLGKEVKKNVCQLWNQYPKRFAGNNPVSAPIRFFWNSYCQEPPEEQPPTLPPPPPFTGGQCPVRYNILYQTAIISGGTLAGWSSTSSISDAGLVGAISNIRLLVVDQLDEDLSHWSFDGNGEPPYLNQRNKQYRFRVTRPAGTSDFGLITAFGVRFIGLVRFDGQPDTCGNLPQDYPVNPSPPPNNFVFNINEGNNNNLSLQFNADIDFNIPIQFKRSDLDITFDFGGINFDWKGTKENPGGDKTPFPTLPPRTRPPGGRGGGGGGGGGQPGDEGVEEDEPIDVTEETPLEEVEEAEIEILWIKIEVLSIPNNSKYVIEDINPDNTVYFAGYLNWIAGYEDLGDNTPELPIRRQTTLIRKPPDFIGFKVRATNSAALRVTKYTQVKTIPTEDS